MKKLMWGISVFSVVLTAAVMPFLPELVPMHYNIAGEIDRWGSRYENLIFPALILLLSLFWHLMTGHFEKKADKALTQKARAEALSNAKVLRIVGVAMAAMFTVMHGASLYSAYAEARSGATHAVIDIGKVACLLVGVFYIVAGNIMPKAKRNGAVGVRVKWSLHSDTTWAKSNRFGGAALVIAGLLTVVTSVFASTLTSLLLMFAYLFAAVAATLICAQRIYKEEIAGNGK